MNGCTDNSYALSSGHTNLEFFWKSCKILSMLNTKEGIFVIIVIIIYVRKEHINCYIRYLSLFTYVYIDYIFILQWRRGRWLPLPPVYMSPVSECCWRQVLAVQMHDWPCQCSFWLSTFVCLDHCSLLLLIESTEAKVAVVFSRLNRGSRVLRREQAGPQAPTVRLKYCVGL